MNHTKTLTDQEHTHQVVEVETDGKEDTQIFTGTKRECETFVKNSGLITLEVKEL